MNLKRNVFIFIFGSLSYGLIEVAFRGHTHYSMIITGGACLVLINKICVFAEKNKSLIIKCVSGSAIITSLELFVGIIFNIILKQKVWDYSKVPFNFMGQVCPLYSIVWGFITIPAMFICKKIDAVFEQ